MVKFGKNARQIMIFLPHTQKIFRVQLLANDRLLDDGTMTRLDDFIERRKWSMYYQN